MTDAPKLTGWRARVATALGGLAVAVVLYLAVGLAIALGVPVIWLLEQLLRFWRWWAHVWGILGY